jgi:peptidyl-prolyl cis-trans isomerase C
VLIDVAERVGMSTNSFTLGRVGSVVARLARVRLVQFVVLGAVVFGAARVRAGGDEIRLTRVELDAMADAEAKRKKIARNPALALEVDERTLEDEVLYREGLKLGFDKNDGVVRQRVIQKTLFLAEELAGASEAPTEAELRRYYDETRERWVRPERFHFVHVFARDRATLDALVPQVEASVAHGESISALGEPCPVPRDATLRRPEIEAALGDSFLAALAAAEGTAFAGPVRSRLGWHLVQVLDHTAREPASFEEARASLVGPYVAERRQRAVAAYLKRAFREYRVTVDGTTVKTIDPRGRVALRASGSGED